MEDGLYSKAYLFFFKCKNEKEIVNCMKTVMSRGNAGEADLFVARACLDMLSRDNDFHKAQYIKKAFEEDLSAEMLESPLLTLVDFAIECIESQDFELYTQMCNEDFSQALSRDSNLNTMANTVASRHFNGKTIKQENTM